MISVQSKLKTMKKCPNRTCKNRESGASVYQCTHCGNYGCMKGFMLYFGPYNGCWTGKPCPNCGRRNSKKYVGAIV